MKINISSREWPIILFMAISFIDGILGQYYFPNDFYPPTSKWLLPVYVLLIFAWYRTDSAVQHYRRSIWLNIGVIGFAILALPYYLFRTRGFRKGLLATLVVLALLVCSALLTHLGDSLVYYLIRT